MSDTNGSTPVVPFYRPLTAADILAPLLPEPFPLPELGGVVYLYPLSAADAFEFANSRGDGWETAILKTIARIVVDAEGRPLFAGIAPEELKRRLPIHAFNRIQEEVNRRMNAGHSSAAAEATGGDPVTNPFVQTAGESSGEPSSEPVPQPANANGLPDAPNPTTTTTWTDRTQPAPAP